MSHGKRRGCNPRLSHASNRSLNPGDRSLAAQQLQAFEQSWASGLSGEGEAEGVDEVAHLQAFRFDPGVDLAVEGSCSEIRRRLQDRDQVAQQRHSLRIVADSLLESLLVVNQCLVRDEVFLIPQNV